MRTMFLVLLICSSTPMALQAADPLREATHRAAVQMDAQGLYAVPPTTADLVLVRTRIVADGGQVIRRLTSHGEPMFLDLASLPDGEYQYEIVSIIAVPPEQQVNGINDPEISTREFGLFRVQDSKVLAPQLASSMDLE